MDCWQVTIELNVAPKLDPKKQDSGKGTPSGGD